MKTTLQTILDDKDLLITYIINEEGKGCFVGESERYYPYKAVSSDSIRCFLKFAIPLDEQKRMAASMTTVQQ